MAEVGPLDEFQRAQAEVLRARIAFATNRGSDAPPLLLAAARRLEPAGRAAGARDLPRRVDAALFNGRLAVGGGDEAGGGRGACGTRRHPIHARRTCSSTASRRSSPTGPSAGTPRVRVAVAAFARRDVEPAEALRWRWLAGRAAGFIWDYEGWDRLTDHHIRAAREAGHARGAGPGAHHARRCPSPGRRDARPRRRSSRRRTPSRGRQAAAIAPRYGALALAAHRGREDELLRLARVATEDFVARGEGLGVTATNWVTALLYNGLGRYEDAFIAAAEATSGPGRDLVREVCVGGADRSGGPHRSPARKPPKPWSL